MSSCDNDWVCTGPQLTKRQYVFPRDHVKSRTCQTWVGGILLALIFWQCHQRICQMSERFDDFNTKLSQLPVFLRSNDFVNRVPGVIGSNKWVQPNTPDKFGPSHSVESTSMVDPQWNIWYWGSKWNLRTVCWSAVGCEWGTTSVYFGITYVCFISCRLPVFAVEPQYLLQYFFIFVKSIIWITHTKS